MNSKKKSYSEYISFKTYHNGRLLGSSKSFIDTYLKLIFTDKVCEIQKF